MEIEFIVEKGISFLTVGELLDAIAKSFTSNIASQNKLKLGYLLQMEVAVKKGKLEILNDFRTPTTITDLSYVISINDATSYLKSLSLKMKIKWV